MRHPRILGDPQNSANFYHCMSRSIDKRLVFESLAEKARFRFLLRAYAKMSGIRVLTYCIMRNHFHLLLEVPHRDAQALQNLSDEELLGRLAPIYAPKGLAIVRQELAVLKAQGGTAHRDYRAKFEARMLDLPIFMRELKQRYTQWYNTRVTRKGTLWEDRYKSVLVEALLEDKGGPAGGGALQTIAAYIDLNPVRAGIVADPKSFRWSGYGEAIGGNHAAREGIVRTVGDSVLSPSGDSITAHAWRHHAAAYRLFMFEEGSRSGQSNGPEGNSKRSKTRPRFSEKQLEAVRRRQGHLPGPDILRLRCRYFADGLAIGSERFVEEVFRRVRSNLGVKREKGARRPRDIALGELHTLSDLRGDVSG
jgi:putative transposase